MLSLPRGCETALCDFPDDNDVNFSVEDKTNMRLENISIAEELMRTI